MFKLFLNSLNVTKTQKITADKQNAVHDKHVASLIIHKFTAMNIVAIINKTHSRQSKERKNRIIFLEQLQYNTP